MGNVGYPKGAKVLMNPSIYRGPGYNQQNRVDRTRFCIYMNNHTPKPYTHVLLVYMCRLAQLIVSHIRVMLNIY